MDNSSINQHEKNIPSKNNVIFSNLSSTNDSSDDFDNHNYASPNNTKDIKTTKKSTFFQNLDRPMRKDLNPLQSKVPISEKIPAIVTITTSIIPNNEKITINITIIKDSFTKMFTKNLSLSASMVPSCIPINSEISFKTALPSVMRADSDLILEYFENLLKNIYIEHDRNTKINRCCI